VQGDEPLIDPKALDLVASLLERHPSADMATLAVPIMSLDQWKNPNCVKVVCDAQGRALYFSRSPIPYVRDAEPNLVARRPRFLRHLGLYAYRRDFLMELAAAPPEPLEQLEKLEQLRVLALGREIQVGIVAHSGSGVDTRADYDRFVRLYRQSHRRDAA